MLRGRTVAAALAVLLLAACGGGDDSGQPSATDDPAGRQTDTPSRDVDDVPEDDPVETDVDMAAVCDGLDVAAAGDVIGVEFKRAETDPGRCAWSGTELTVFAVNPGPRERAMRDFPLTGTVVDESELLGMPTITRDDGGGRYGVAVFADQWYVSVIAARSPELLEEALAAAVEPVTGG